MVEACWRLTKACSSCQWLAESARSEDEDIPFKVCCYPSQGLDANTTHMTILDSVLVCTIQEKSAVVSVPKAGTDRVPVVLDLIDCETCRAVKFQALLRIDMGTPIILQFLSTLPSLTMIQSIVILSKRCSSQRFQVFDSPARAPRIPLD